MKRTLAALAIALSAVLGWHAFSDSSEANDAAKPAHLGDEEARELEVEVLTPEPAPADLAPVDESTERVEIAPASAPKELGLTLRGLVQHRLGQPVENFGIRGIRKDANNAFVEERVWDLAHHAGGVFELAGLEPHAWELAPFAEGFTLERGQRFVRSNERPVVFRMLSRVEVSGIVVDAEGTPVPEALVRADEVAGARELGYGKHGAVVATADTSGRFRLSLDAGVHQLLASHDGHAQSAPQRIEVAALRPLSNLELRLNDGCSVRIDFDRSALGDDAPVFAVAASLADGRVAKSLPVAEDESHVTFKGLSPGWTRLIVIAGSPPPTGYSAAVELELGRPLELTFELRRSEPVVVRVRAPEQSDATPEFRGAYDFLPTLPNLNWLESSRESSGDEQVLFDPRWTSPSEWTAPGSGSYVAFPRWPELERGAAPKRFEAPRTQAFDLVLPVLPSHTIFGR